MRPNGCAIGVLMLHRIDVNVINVAAEIIFITDQVFPKSSLPYATLAFAAPRGRNILGTRNRARKAGLDQAPATGKIGVTFRQRPYRVHVVRQDDPCNDRKRMPALDKTDSVTQSIDVFDQQTTGTVSQIDREEIRSACDINSSVLHPCISLLQTGRLVAPSRLLGFPDEAESAQPTSPRHPVTTQNANAPCNIALPDSCREPCSRV